tara:strand:- start:7081 stop:7635 length:555 start_codon:yes stop_codon:yes gene_type:complete
MWRTKQKREIKMSENRTYEATKILKSFEQLIDTVCERKISWTDERQLLDKLSEVRDYAVNTVYDFNRSEEARHNDSYEHIGIAQGIEFALSTMGVSSKAYREDIMSVRDEIGNVIEDMNKRTDKELTSRHKTMTRLEADNKAMHIALCGIAENDFESPSKIAEYTLTECAHLSGCECYVCLKLN